MFCCHHQPNNRRVHHFVHRLAHPGPLQQLRPVVVLHHNPVKISHDNFSRVEETARLGMSPFQALFQPGKLLVTSPYGQKVGDTSRYTKLPVTP